MSSSPKLPAPDASDPREVAFALEEAIAHWAAGKKGEALYALSRAADAAEHASLAARAGVLRAACAELGAAPSNAPAAGSGRPPPPSAVARAAAAPVARSGASSHAPPPPSARAPAGPALVAVPAPDAAGTSGANGANADVSSSVDTSNGAHRGLHVWVRTSARDPTLLLVRLLPDGHPAPPGAYEAYLRPVDDGANLLTPKH